MFSKIFYDDCSDAFINETDATLESISNKIPHNITHLPISSPSNTSRNNVTDNIINIDTCNIITVIISFVNCAL